MKNKQKLKTKRNEDNTNGVAEEETIKTISEKDAMITTKEEAVRSKAEDEEEEFDKINSENEAKAKVYEEIVNILLEEEVKIFTEEKGASIDTSMKNELNFMIMYLW